MMTMMDHLGCWGCAGEADKPQLIVCGLKAGRNNAASFDHRAPGHHHHRRNHLRRRRTGGRTARRAPGAAQTRRC